MNVSVIEALEKLAQTSGQLFAKVMQHGTMSVELYRPLKTDPQTPHRQDEIYVVISGSGVFTNNGERNTFRPGDVLFVKAGVTHRFENFTHDFLVWVIFYGPDGGEK